MDHRKRLKPWLVCARLIEREYASLAGNKAVNHHGDRTSIDWINNCLN